MTVQPLSKHLLVSAVSALLCVASAVAAAQSPSDAAQAPAQSSIDLPDSPGTVRYPSRVDIAQAAQPSQPLNQDPANQAPATQAPTTETPASTQDAPQTPPPAQTSPTQRNVQKPAGTAASPIENSTGIAASKPAGVAIAPAKQKRSRSILIKVGALVGAGAALGTVMALSQASPSKPPGAH